MRENSPARIFPTVLGIYAFRTFRRFHDPYYLPSPSQATSNSNKCMYLCQPSSTYKEILSSYTFQAVLR